MYKPMLYSHCDFAKLWLTLDQCPITHLANEVLIWVQPKLYVGSPLFSVTSAMLEQEMQRVPCLLSTFYWRSADVIMASCYITYVLPI
jgi:hypothetical protein